MTFVLKGHRVKSVFNHPTTNYIYTTIVLSALYLEIKFHLLISYRPVSKQSVALSSYVHVAKVQDSKRFIQKPPPCQATSSVLLLHSQVSRGLWGVGSNQEASSQVLPGERGRKDGREVGSAWSGCKRITGLSSFILPWGFNPHPEMHGVTGQMWVLAVVGFGSPGRIHSARAVTVLRKPLQAGRLSSSPT